MPSLLLLVVKMRWCGGGERDVVWLVDWAGEILLVSAFVFGLQYTS